MRVWHFLSSVGASCARDIRRPFASRARSYRRGDRSRAELAPTDSKRLTFQLKIVYNKVGYEKDSDWNCFHALPQDVQNEKGITMLDNKEIISLLQAPMEQFADRSAKWLLGQTDNLQGLLEIIGSEIVASLDFSKVQLVNTTFIPDNLREQESDMVFLLPFRDADETEVMIYILIEHQSTVDPVMAFRLLFYMCLIWDQQRQKWVSENVPKSAWRFRPIIPVLFYTGEERWQTLPSLETLIDAPEALTRFIPRFETLFLGVKSASDETLLKTERPFGWLLTLLKQEFADASAFIAALERLGVHLDTLSDADKELWKQAIYYLYLLIFQRRPAAERETLKEIVGEHQKSIGFSTKETKQMQTIANYYVEQGLEQGLEQGRINEKRTDVLKIVRYRFAEKSDTVLNEITAINDLGHLDDLFDQVLAAETFEDIDFSKNGK